MKIVLVYGILFLYFVNGRMILGSVLKSDASAESSESDDVRTPSQKVFDSIPEEARSNFITFHLGIAIQELNRTDVHLLPKRQQLTPKDMFGEFEDVNVPDGFSTSLFEWAEAHFIPKRPFIMLRPRKQLSPVVCFPSGCVDPGDIGSICCPF